MRKLDSAQALRGIAALLVFFFHASIFLNHKSLLTLLFHNGNIGVTLFFILSGFLMAYTTDKVNTDGLHNSKKFLFKRCIRVLPLYYFTTVVMIILAHKIPYYLSHHSELIKTLLFIPLHLQSEGPTYGTPLLYVGWTLNYEILFYALFAFSLLFRRLHYIVLFAIFFALLIVLPYALKGYISFTPQINYRFSPEYLNFITNPIMIYFVAGVCMGLGIHKLSVSRTFTLILFICSTLLFLLYYFDFILIFTKEFSDFIISVLLVGAVLLLSVRDDIPTPAFLIYLGDISYSIYLIHPLIIFYIPNLLIKFGFESWTQGWGFILFITALVLVCSAISYAWIEKKVSAIIRRRVLYSV